MRLAQFALGLAISAAVTTGAASSSALTTQTDGRIAFVRAGNSLDTEIWTADRSGRKRRLIHLARAAADKPAWSANGRWIAFAVDHDPPAGAQLEIYSAHADGTGIRRLTGGAAKTVDTDPAWSPDGRQIAFSKSTHGDLRGLGVYVMRSDGGRQRRLTRNRCDYGPTWSPTGKKVIFSRCGRLVIANADGTHQRGLPRPPSGETDEQPDWSPDGRWIAFVRIDRDNLTTLYVIRPSGAGERQVTDGGDEWSPAWSRDGRLLAFSSFTTIKTVAPATGRVRGLVRMRGSDLSNPAWQR